MPPLIHVVRRDHARIRPQGKNNWTVGYDGQRSAVKRVLALPEGVLELVALLVDMCTWQAALAVGTLE